MSTRTEPITRITEADRRPLWVMGAVFDLVIDGNQTGGAYAVAEDRSFPGFEEIGEPVTDPDASPPPPDPKRLLEASVRYGVELKLGGGPQP